MTAKVMPREPRRRTVDLSSVLNQTARNNDHLDYYRRVLDDPDKEARIAKQLCQVCQYQGRIGGSMMTTQQCARCETVTTFSNTCVDVLCQPCAKGLRLCKHCGGDMDNKMRRKL
jgi:hypothetical protein